MLKIENLFKRFGGLTAVKNLTFSVNRGDIKGLIGPNGAGKTTVFNLITGLLRPDSGRIEFKGENILGYSPNEICNRGLCRTFQITKPFAKLSVIDNVTVGALCREKNLKQSKLKAIEILKFTDLFNKKNILAKNLTIADRKRLELARALATDPELLLLDEIFAGLNPKEIEYTIEMIKKIYDKGITMLLIEHVMKAIMALSDLIVVINYGGKIAEGTPDEIAKNKNVIEAYLGEGFKIA